MNNQNADIDSSQTQRAKSNHESNSQALFEKMKARMIELMQRILTDFMKTQQQASSTLSELSAALHQRSHEDRSISRSSSYEQAFSIK